MTVFRPGESQGRTAAARGRPRHGLERQRGRGVHRGLLPKDRLLEPLERRSRLDPELLQQLRARRPIRLEGLRLPAAAVEGQHELAPQPFPQRVLGDQALQLSRQAPVPAQREVGVDAFLARRQP